MMLFRETSGSWRIIDAVLQAIPLGTYKQFLDYIAAEVYGKRKTQSPTWTLLMTAPDDLAVASTGSFPFKPSSRDRGRVYGRLWTDCPSINGRRQTSCDRLAGQVTPPCPCFQVSHA